MITKNDILRIIDHHLRIAKKDYNPRQPRDKNGRWVSYKHLPGQHDQKTHGRRGNIGNSYDLSEKVTNREMMRLARDTEMTDAQARTLQGMNRAYSAGTKYSKYSSLNQAINYDDDVYGITRDMSFEEMVAFEAGMRGANNRFAFVTAWRVGDVPKGGKSTNFAEQILEPGISVMATSNGLKTQDPLSAAFLMAKNKPIIYLSGFVHPFKKGGDGEPLLLQTKILKRIEPKR